MQLQQLVYFMTVADEGGFSKAAEKLLAACGYTLEDVKAGNITELKTKAEAMGYEALSETCGAGAPTLADIVKELSKPGRDPRDELPPPILRTDVMEAKDLKPGMELQGTVRNVIDFGAFGPGYQPGYDHSCLMLSTGLFLAAR